VIIRRSPDLRTATWRSYNGRTHARSAPNLDGWAGGNAGDGKLRLVSPAPHGLVDQNPSIRVRIGHGRRGQAGGAHRRQNAPPGCSGGFVVLRLFCEVGWLRDEAHRALSASRDRPIHSRFGSGAVRTPVVVVPHVPSNGETDVRKDSGTHLNRCDRAGRRKRGEKRRRMHGAWALIPDAGSTFLVAARKVGASLPVRCRTLRAASERPKLRLRSSLHEPGSSDRRCAEGAREAQVLQPFDPLRGAPMGTIIGYRRWRSAHPDAEQPSVSTATHTRPALGPEPSNTRDDAAIPPRPGDEGGSRL